MSYTALYRKFRPASFDDVKGQDHIVTTLRNQLKADRLGHAYLFCGTRGTGKTSIAKLLAKAANCENPVDGSPCCQCQSCQAIAAGSSMNVIEIDAASNNSVDNIREIIEEVSYSPTSGRFKVYIIDEVHMLSISAFNALLKTLEEPPSYVIFILATTEVHKLPITILSRCQRYDFKRIGIQTIADRMQDLMDAEGVETEERALRYIAKVADGSMRDALSLLDQCIAFHFGTKLTYEMALDVLGAVDTEVFSNLLRNVLASDVLSSMKLLEDVIMQGRELNQFVTDFIWYLRNLLLVKSSDQMDEVIEMSNDNLSRLKEEATQLSQETIIRYIRIFSELSNQMKYASQKRVLLEIALIKLCVPAMESDQDSVLERVRVVEDKLEKGITVTNVVAAAPERPVQKAPLPAALPEDIQQIIGRWMEFVNSCDNPAKIHLKRARVSLGVDNQLLLVFNGESGIAGDYFEQTENRNALVQALGDYYQKQVPVVIQKVETEREMDEKFPDILQMIQMNVEIES